MSVVRQLLILLLIFTFCAQAADDAGRADFQASLQFYKLKNYSKSLAIQKELVKKYPRNALYWFNLGTSAYMLDDFSRAEKAFRTVENLESPLAPASKLYRAKTEIALKRKQNAKKLLQELVSSAKTPSSVRTIAEEELSFLTPRPNEIKNAIMKLYQSERYEEAFQLLEKVQNPDLDMKILRGMLLVKLDRPAEAQEYLANIQDTADADRVSILQNLIDQTKREHRSRKPYWAYVEGVVGFNTNSYYDSPDDGSLGARFMKNNWGAGGRLVNRGSWALLSGYSGSWEEVEKAGNLKVVSHQIQFNATYDTPIDFLQASPYYQYDEWAGEAGRKRGGMRLKYRRLWSTSAAGTELDFALVRGQNAPYSYLSGKNFSARLYWAMDTKRIYAQFYFDYERSWTGDYVYSDKSVLPIAFEGRGPGVRILYRQTGDWLFSFQGNVQHRTYSTLTAPDNRERIDNEITLSFRETRVWTPKFSGYIGLTYLKNISSLDSGDVRDENYDATMLTAGVQWEIL